MKINSGLTYNIKLKSDKTLLAGPWVGEFGWELCCWQAHVRRISREYNKTIIVSRKGREFLYEDFANEFHIYNSPTVEANMWFGSVNEKELNELLKSIHYDEILKPFNVGYNFSENNSTRTSTFNNQEFIKFKSDSINKYYDIIIHPRNRMLGVDRNWNAKNWQNLIDLLDKDYSIAEIGDDSAFELTGVDKYRNVSVRDTVSLMNRAKIIVGQASGPLHLAAMCDAPHFVWAYKYSKVRFEIDWNPHNTKLCFYEVKDWNPTVDEIYEGIINFMHELKNEYSI